MMHENAYVASVSLSADVNQTVKARISAGLGLGFRVSGSRILYPKALSPHKGFRVRG